MDPVVRSLGRERLGQSRLDRKTRAAGPRLQEALETRTIVEPDRFQSFVQSRQRDFLRSVRRPTLQRRSIHRHFAERPRCVLYPTAFFLVLGLRAQYEATAPA